MGTTESIVSDKTIGFSNNQIQTAITRFSRLDRKPAGKTILADGSKIVADHAGHYQAETIRLAGQTPGEILAGLDAILAGLDTHQLISLSYAPNLPDAYLVRPQSWLERHTGTDGLGIYYLDGNQQPTIARKKQHFQPSLILLLDHDPDPAMPELWHALDSEGRWRLLCDALPQFGGAARLIVPSSSGRVLSPSGEPLKARSGEHCYVVLDRAITSTDLDDMRDTLEVKLWTHDLGYQKPDKNGVLLKRALIDSAPFKAGHEVFAAAPVVLEPYRLADRRSTLIDGGTATPVLSDAITTEERRDFERRTGGKVETITVTDTDGSTHRTTRTRARIVLADGDRLKLDTEIDTELGTMTAAQFLESGRDKLRCQATFRESSSYAGILRRTKYGCVLIDTGDSNKQYRLSHDPDALTGDLQKDLAMLRAATPAQAPSLARALVFRHAWRCPAKLEYRQLYRAICTAHEAVNQADIKALLQWLAGEARRLALAAVTIDPAALPHYVTVHYCETITEIKAGIDASGGGCHVVKAPHASGKTSGLLVPLSKAGSYRVASAPRRTLVTALSEKCDLKDYRAPGAHTEIDLALCANSLPNPKYRTAIDAAQVVLLDEGARIVRDTHDARSTHGRKARTVWEALTAMIRRAELTVAVDADWNTADVSMLARAVGKLDVWIIGEKPRTISALFTSRDRLYAEIFDTLDAGKSCWITADSAREIAGLAAKIQADYPALRVLAVHDLAGLSTLGTEAVKAFLADVNAQARLYDVVLCSPAVESGISLEKAHFQRHFALYGGVLEPSAMNQALLRDRTASAWTIAIKNSGKQSRPDTEAAALNALAAAQRIVTARDDGSFTFAPATEYDTDTCRTMAAAAASRNRYAADLWFLLEARGWTLALDSTDDTDDAHQALEARGAALRTEAKDILLDAQTSAILVAPILSDRRLEELATAHAVTPDESAALARADVAAATGQHSEKITDIEIDAWKDGALHGFNQNFDALTASTEPTERDRLEHETDVPRSLRSLDAARAAALQRLFDVLGIDPLTGAGSFKDADALRVWHDLKDTDEGRALEHFGICRFDRVPKRPVSWISAALRRLGLHLDSKAEGHGGKDGRRYWIDPDPKRRDGVLVSPGWTLMALFQARRRVLAGDSSSTADGDSSGCSYRLMDSTVTMASGTNTAEWRQAA